MLTGPDSCVEDGSKVAYGTVRAGRNELWERSIAEGRERLLLASTDWRFTKPRVSTVLLLPMTEERSEIWMVNQADR